MRLETVHGVEVYIGDDRCENESVREGRLNREKIRDSRTLCQLGWFETISSESKGWLSNE